MKITRSGECGNSPKNAFVEDFVIAWISGGNVSEMLSAEAHIPAVTFGDVAALTIVHAISHGRVGACNGVADVGGQLVPFAMVLEFANTKGDRVRRIDLYRAD